MPIASSDIDYHHSGAASLNAAQEDPNASLGGYRASTQLTNNVDNNLFDDVTGAEHTAGDVEYRCIYIRNAHATLTLTSAVVWIQSDTSGADSDISIAVGTAAINGKEQGPLANESTAPEGVTWSDAATSRATGLSLGDIPAEQHKAVWIRRTISAGSTPQAADTCSVQAGGDTL